MARLSLTFCTNEWEGECRIDLGDSRFTAKSAYPSLQASEFAEFLTQLQTYPLTREVSGSWYGGRLILTVRQTSNLGGLTFTAFVGHYHLRDHTFVDLATDYASLKDFTDQLSAVIANGSGTAELSYEPTSY